MNVRIKISFMTLFFFGHLVAMANVEQKTNKQACRFDLILAGGKVTQSFTSEDTFYNKACYQAEKDCSWRLSGIHQNQMLGFYCSEINRPSPLPNEPDLPVGPGTVSCEYQIINSFSNLVVETVRKTAFSKNTSCSFAATACLDRRDQAYDKSNFRCHLKEIPTQNVYPDGLPKMENWPYVGDAPGLIPAQEPAPNYKDVRP